MTKNVIFAILTVALFTSCNGTTGPQGKDGNANVHSYLYNVSSNDWEQVSPDYKVTLSTPYITQDILDKGAVLVYIEAVAQNYWLLLPYSDYNSLLLYITTVGQIEIYSGYFDRSQKPNPGAHTFKVVAIAGSELLIMPKNLDLTNYQEVAKYFNIMD